MQVCPDTSVLFFFCRCSAKQLRLVYFAGWVSYLSKYVFFFFIFFDEMIQLFFKPAGSLDFKAAPVGQSVCLKGNFVLLINCK